jgi:UDP-GlcNAc:undecaprenyl-phosphate GlcNAc-1-phosphate transferase
VPLFDTSFVSLIRLYRGDSPFRGSPDHFALRLRKRGWSSERIVLASALAGLLTGLLSVVNMGLAWEESLSLYVVVGALFLGVALWLGRVRMP